MNDLLRTLDGEQVINLNLTTEDDEIKYHVLSSEGKMIIQGLIE